MSSTQRSTAASAALPYFTANDVERLLPLDRAIAAIEAAVREEPGIDPEQDSPRLFSPAPNGSFLLMPAQGPAFSGLKALTVAPENPTRGLEKIQGLYVLYSSDTLAPVAVIEGASLTAIRTPAVTLSAVRRLAAISPESNRLPENPKVLVFGAGVQALSHIRAASLTFPNATFDIAGRRPERVATAIDALRSAAETADSTVQAVPEGQLDEAISNADIIICVTTASSPIFDGSLVRNGAIVAAAGSHGLDHREVDDVLVQRSDIVVEARASAQRESGNLISLADDQWRDAGRPGNLRELARGEFSRTPDRPALYTGVGMSWEDLVCAEAIFLAAGHSGAEDR